MRNYAKSLKGRPAAVFAAATLVTLILTGAPAMAEDAVTLSADAPAAGDVVVMDDAPAAVVDDANELRPDAKPAEDAAALTADANNAEAKAGEEDDEEYIAYLDELGRQQKIKASECIDISDKSAFKEKVGYGLGDGWYYMKSGRYRFFENRLTITGDAKLILGDGCWADFRDGIRGYSGKLTIYGQSTGKDMGYLKAVTTGGNAGIGGNNDEDNNTEIVICGGHIEAKGKDYGAGIGGGNEVDGGTISISGGHVVSRSDSTTRDLIALGVGAGIGGGDEGDSGTITITGGTVEATADRDEGAAIGHGGGGKDQKVSIPDDYALYDDSGRRVTAPARLARLAQSGSVKLMLCDHAFSGYVQTGGGHRRDCPHCMAMRGEEEPHTPGKDGVCTVCGH